MFNTVNRIQDGVGVSSIGGKWGAGSITEGEKKPFVIGEKLHKIFSSKVKGVLHFPWCRFKRKKGLWAREI